MNSDSLVTRNATMTGLIRKIILLTGMFVIGCTDFSTSFEEIEENRVRTIDFIYRNCADTTLCEAAPGDSMEVTALFTGEEVRDIEITASFNVQTSLYGQSHAFDEQPLDYRTVHSSLRKSGATDADTLIFRFLLPAALLKTSSFLPEKKWVEEIPEAFRPLIPSSFSSRTRSQVISLLDQFADQLDVWDSLAPGERADDSLYRIYSTDFIPAAVTLLQLFSARAQLNVTVNSSYNIQSFCTVRYHRLFSRLETVSCNRNPTIIRMGIYRVKENNITWFDPEKHNQPFETILLYDAEKSIRNEDYTLTIRKNESYFFFAGSDAPEPTPTVDGAIITENQKYEWFFQQDRSGAEEEEPHDLVSLINASDGPVVPLFPSETGAIERCSFWVQVRDEAIGPRLYPTGSSVFSIRIQFDYSPDFLE